MEIKTYVIILLFIKSIYCNNLCNKINKYSSCIENRCYKFNMCVIYSYLNRNNSNVKKCIHDIKYPYDIYGSYNNINLSCDNKTLNISNPKTLDRIEKEINLTFCLLKNKNISYNNHETNCREIDGELDIKKFYKCL